MKKAISSPRFRMIALSVGLLLVTAAIVYAVRRVDFSPIIHAPWWVVPVMALCVAINQTLASMLVCIQTQSFDMTAPIGQRRMWHLTAASRLLNLLPMQPGLLGRASYLHLRHGMPVRQTGLSLLLTLGYGAAIVAPIGLVALMAPSEWRTVAIWITSLAFMVGYPLVDWIARLLLRRPMVMAWSWAPLRLADLVVNAFKTWLAFRAMGVEIAFSAAIGLKAAGVIIEMFGFTPQGLGLREWAVAAITRLCRLGPNAPVALAATLIERAVEVPMTILMGIIGTVALQKELAPEE